MDDIPQAEAPEIDIDSLDDKAFDELKGKMRAEQPVEAPPKTDTNRAADGKFAKTEPAAEAVAEELGDDGAKPNETVPHGQFHRERERRKAAEAAQEKLRADYTKLMDRTAQLLQRDAAPIQQEQAPEIPRWDQNPVEAGQWTQDRLIEMQRTLQSRDQQAQQQNAEAQHWQAIISTANEQFAEAEKADPSVREAYNALKSSYTAELKALGHTPQSAEQELAKIEAQGIRYALEAGIPVANYVVNLATARGWQKAAPVTAATGKTDAEKIAERETTRLAAQSLGKAGGAVVNTGIITPEQLLEMSDEDFAAYKKKHGSVAHAFAQAS